VLSAHTDQNFGSAARRLPLSIRCGTQLRFPRRKEYPEYSSWVLCCRARPPGAWGLSQQHTLACLSSDSCYGRAHPEAVETLTALARTAARKRGLADYRPLLRRANATIAIQIWSRAAAMVQACLPDLPPEEVSLLFADGGVP